MDGVQRGRPRSFDRSAALDIAVRLFWERGYERTSVRDLTEHLGVEAPSLYRAFGDKRALFEESLQEYNRRYGDLIGMAMRDQSSSYQVAAYLLTEGPARYTRTGLPLGCLVISGDAGASDARVLSLMSAIRASNVDQLRQRILRDVEAGLLPEEVDPGALAIFTMNALSGLADSARAGVPREELTRVGLIALSVWPRPIVAP